MKVEKVLIPTDFSENSHIAIDTAKVFVELFGCKVDLIHVVPVSSYLGESISNLGIPIDMNSDIYPKIIDEANKKLLNFSEEHFEPGVVQELLLPVDRKPYKSIIDHANKGDYDLIIMSAKGEDNTDFLHGSVTEKVIRHSEIPVLALDSKIHHEKIKTVSVPTDLSEFSLEVLPMAFQVARKFGANLQLLHVIEPYSLGMEIPVDGHQPIGENISPIDEEETYAALQNKIEEHFDGYHVEHLSLKRNEQPYYDEIVLTSGSVSESTPVRTVIKKGVNAHHEILDYANDNADLLVMATHGRTGLKRMLMGSTTEQVVQHLQLPLLTVKSVSESVFESS